MREIHKAHKLILIFRHRISLDIAEDAALVLMGTWDAASRPLLRGTGAGNGLRPLPYQLEGQGNVFALAGEMLYPQRPA